MPLARTHRTGDGQMLCQRTQMMRAGLQTKVKLLTRAGRLTGRRKDLLNLANILAGMNLLMHG